MFDKIGRAAEWAAEGASRRAFLSQFGRLAAVAAGVVGGLLATAKADAGSKKFCCLAGGSYGWSSCSAGKCFNGGKGGGDYIYVTVRCADYPWICPQ